MIGSSFRVFLFFLFEVFGHLGSPGVCTAVSHGCASNRAPNRHKAATHGLTCVLARPCVGRFFQEHGYAPFLFPSFSPSCLSLSHSLPHPNSTPPPGCRRTSPAGDRRRCHRRYVFPPFSFWFIFFIPLPFHLFFFSIALVCPAVPGRLAGTHSPLWLAP